MNKLLPAAFITLALALTGCGASSQPVNPSGPAAVVQSPAGAQASGSGVATTPRGTMLKKVGEQAGLTNMDGSVLLQFTINEIAAAQCKSGAFGKKAQGQYIALSLTIQTLNDPQGQLPLMSFGTGWEHVTKDGVTTEASTLDASVCGTNYVEYGPNRTYYQTVVLDVPKDSKGGVITFRPAGNSGWEWQLDT